jgi:hypothetical protein
MPLDLYADGSLFLSYKAAIPRLYTDVAETLSRTRLRAWPTTKLQAIACDTPCRRPVSWKTSVAAFHAADTVIACSRCGTIQ